MNIFTKEMVFRKFKTMGVEASGKHEVDKDEAQEYFGQLEMAASLGAVMAETKAELQGVTNKPDYTPGMVGADPDKANNGYYQFKGGTWHFVREFPDSITRLINVGGTANEIQTELRTGVSLSSLELVYFVPVKSNTGAVTLTIESKDYPLINGLGANLDPDDIQQGYPALVAVTETGAILLNPANVEAVALAAKAGAVEALRQFKKLFLDPRASDPATDDDGEPLKVGASYYNTTLKKTRIYTPDGWDLYAPDYSAFMRKDKNLADLQDKSAARNNLGLGALATLDQITNTQIAPKTIYGSKLADNAVTDIALNSGILNRLNGLPKVVAMYSNIGSGRTFNLSFTNNAFVFDDPLPDTRYVVRVGGQYQAIGNSTFVNLLCVWKKSKEWFQVGGFRLSGSGGISTFEGGIEIVVYR